MIKRIALLLTCLAALTPSALSAGLRTVRIRAVGDVMVHQKQLDIARQSDGSYDFHDQFSMIASSLSVADYTIANLETTIGKYRDRDYSGYPHFNAPESLLDALRDAGVDFLTLANNHILDRWGEGMVQTVQWVDDYGFEHGGANRTQAEHDTPVIVKVNGVKLGFLCYTEGTNGHEDKCSPKVKQFGVNYLKKADFAADARWLRSAGAEVVIALPHWGTEYQREPDARQTAWAKAMVAAGVDIVLGSHPHVAQKVELVRVQSDDGQTRTGLVAYSLGNFISSMTKRYTDSGLVLDITLREKKGGGFELAAVGAVPVYCWKQDDMIRAIPAARYDLKPPDGMSDADAGRMRESCRELRTLLDERIAFMLE